jgi:hypothetical protein
LLLLLLLLQLPLLRLPLNYVQHSPVHSVHMLQCTVLLLLLLLLP